EGLPASWNPPRHRICACSLGEGSAMDATHGSDLRRLSRRGLLSGGLALGGGLAVRALGGGGAEAAAAQPKRGGTLVAAQEVDPVSLDPHTNSNFSALQGYEHIYESLTGYDEKTNIVPALAERWEIQNGGKTYVFHLRPNVK